MNIKNILFLAFLLSLNVACSKSQEQDTETQTTETTTASTPNNPAASVGERTLTPEEQAEQTYARARKLSMEEASDFVKYPNTFHEKIASRLIRRVMSTITLSETQQQDILKLLKSYPENSIKGKEGKAKRREAIKRAYTEVLTPQQQEKVSSIISEF